MIFFRKFFSYITNIYSKLVPNVEGPTAHVCSLTWCRQLSHRANLQISPYPHLEKHAKMLRDDKGQSGEFQIIVLTWKATLWSSLGWTTHGPAYYLQSSSIMCLLVPAHEIYARIWASSGPNSRSQVHLTAIVEW